MQTKLIGLMLVTGINLNHSIYNNTTYKTGGNIVDLLGQILEIITKFAIIGGGLWTVWGAIVLAGGLKDKNGPQLQAGIWQTVGGGLIIAAAALFSNVLAA